MGNQPNAVGRERRRHRRFSCSLGAEVVVRHTSMLFRGSVRDISRSGCFIESKARLKLASKQEVELQFSSRGIQVNSLARVMDIRPGVGAGFEFIAEDPRLEQPLLKLIGWLDGGPDQGGAGSR
jgi:hypothetical protein